MLVVADSTDTTLSGFRERRSFKAEDGEAGARSKRSGHQGADLTLHVPVGTIVREGDVVLADLDRAGAVALGARGGRGGRGNTRFATATRQAPRAGELGDLGEKIPEETGNPDALYKTERDFLKTYQAIPLLYLPRALAVGERVRDLRLAADGTPVIADVSIDGAK